MLLNTIKEVAFCEKVFWTGFVQFLNFQKHRELILWVASSSCRWLFCLRNSVYFIYFLSFNCFWGLTRLSHGVLVPFGHQSYSICWCNSGILIYTVHCITSLFVGTSFEETFLVCVGSSQWSSFYLFFLWL